MFAGKGNSRCSRHAPHRGQKIPKSILSRVLRTVNANRTGCTLCGHREQTRTMRLVPCTLPSVRLPQRPVRRSSAVPHAATAPCEFARPAVLTLRDFTPIVPQPRQDEGSTERATTRRPAQNTAHWIGADRDRAGLRVRLFGNAGLQGAARGELRSRPGQLESGHHHDRSRTRPIGRTSSR